MERPGETLTRGPATLQRVRAGDVDAIRDLVTGSLEHLRPWMPWAQDYTPRSTVEFAAGCERDWESGTAFGYRISAGGIAVGCCGLHARIGPGGLEIGYWIGAGHVLQGLATAAAGALVSAAFAMPSVGRVEIVHDEANVASAGVPRKLGFTQVSRDPAAGGPVCSGESGVEVRWRLTR